MTEQLKTPGALAGATEGLGLASVGNSTLSSDPLQEPLDAVTDAERDVSTWRADVAAWRASEGDTPLPLLAYREHPAASMVAQWLDVRMAVLDLPLRGVDGWRDAAAEILSVPLDDLPKLARDYERFSEVFEREIVRAKTAAKRAEALDQSLTFEALAVVVWTLATVHTGMTQDDDPQPVDFPAFVTLRVTA